MPELLRRLDLQSVERRKPSPCLFESPAWLGVLQASYPLQLWYSEPRPGSILFWAESRFLGPSRFVSLPYSDYTLPGLSSGELRSHLQALQLAYPSAVFDLRYARLNTEEADTALQSAVLHRIDLAHSQPSASFCRGLRKALRRGIKVNWSVAEADFQEFCAQLKAYRFERFGVLSPPDVFFQQVYLRFLKCGQGRLYRAQLEGRSIAWALILFSGKQAFYKWGCSLPADQPVRPNNLLFHTIREDLAGEGFRFLDLGMSFLEGNDGLRRFKTAMGGTEYPICRIQVYGQAYPRALEEQFKALVGDITRIVTHSKLDERWRDAFSEALYPLFS